jgi:DNA-binding NarL/FixJ family response regulator
VITVVIADDQAVVRAGLRLILEAQEDLQVAGEAADGAAAVEAVRALEPDVVLMDIRMPTLDGIEATRQIVADGGPTRVLVLTTYGLDENVYDALAAGASGFLVKTDSPERLVDAIRVVAAGDALLAPEITRRLIERFVSAPLSTRPPVELEELTAREREVLALLARGMTDAEIASDLYVKRRHGQDARCSRSLEARSARPHPGRRLRLRARRHSARHDLAAITSYARLSARTSGETGPEYVRTVARLACCRAVRGVGNRWQSASLPSQVRTPSSGGRRARVGGRSVRESNRAC